MPYDETEDTPIHVHSTSLLVNFRCVDDPGGVTTWQHHMPVVPRVGDVLRFRCLHALPPDDAFHTPDRALLTTMVWEVMHVEMELICMDDEPDEDDPGEQLLVNGTNITVYVRAKA